MKTRALGLVVGAFALAVIGTSCSTPDSRIKNNPALFNALPPEVQENVRQGKIEVGYSKDAVMLALGKPDRKYERRTATGTVEVWSWTAEYTTTERQHINARVHGRDLQGSTRTYTDWIWVDVDQKHEYDRKRIEFTGDIVSAIETMER